MNREQLTIRIKGRLLDFVTPKVMGIVNVTPDSFYAGSRAADNPGERAASMLADGADILDIGGYSTRPGAAAVSPDEEYDRLAPALEVIRARFPDAILSVDTFRAEVARKCVLNFGADIVNDIAGGTLDPEMRDTVAELGVPYVLMHTRGTPQTMGSLTQYDDVTADVLRDLAFKADDFRQAGVHDLIIDPGFGFPKDVRQNYELLANLDIFHELGAPVLAGMSRKRMLRTPLGITADDAGNATVVAHTMALMNGADIIRVHDVLPAVQSVKLFTLMRDSNPQKPFHIETLNTLPPQ